MRDLPRLWTAVASCAVLAASVAGCGSSTPSPRSGATLTRTSGRAFASTSAFNTPIGASPLIDPRSAAIVKHLAGAGFADAAVESYVPPVYNADATTPRYRMDCTETWGNCDLESVKVPLPAGAAPSAGSDHNMVVIDWSTRRVFEFYKYGNDRHTVGWGAILPLDGSGTGNGTRDPGRYGAVGSGISRLAGIIRTFEVKAPIEHALVGAAGFSCKTGYRYPAVKTDGWSKDLGCIPEGARVQLDPRVTCSSLPHIDPWELRVCQALQKYGWYNIDNGRVGEPGFSVQFQNPMGSDKPYRDVQLFGNSSITHIPLSRLRVLSAWNSHS